MTSTSVDRSLRSYLVLSDIHLGARTTTAEEILQHLTAFFDNFSTTSSLTEVDAIFIAGDLWHDALQFSDAIFALFIPWFSRFLRYAEVNHIVVRLLEGTPRHDRKQNATLASLVPLINPRVNFKYVGDLSIETIEELGMTVLYVPDECRHSTDVLEHDIDSLLAEASLEKVDIAIMHGMFKYQLGTIPMNSKVLDETWFLSRVKYYLSIGHIHTSSQYERILAQGSFDRLSHNEEEAKGAMLIKEFAPNDWMHLFIENTLAKIYKTIKVSGDVEKALKQIERGVKKLPFGSYVRVEAPPAHPIFQGFETLRQTYPLFTFSKKVESETVVKTTTSAPLAYVPVILNRDTLTEALCEEIAGQYAIDRAEYTLIRGLLEPLHL